MTPYQGVCEEVVAVLCMTSRLGSDVVNGCVHAMHERKHCRAVHAVIKKVAL